MVTQHPHRNSAAEVLRVAMVIEQPRAFVVELIVALDFPNGLLFRGLLFGVSRLLLGALSVAGLLLLGLPFGAALLPFGANHVLADAALLRFLADLLLALPLTIDDSRALAVPSGLALNRHELSLIFLAGRLLGLPFRELGLVFVGVKVKRDESHDSCLPVGPLAHCVGALTGVRHAGRIMGLKSFAASEVRVCQPGQRHRCFGTAVPHLLPQKYFFTTELAPNTARISAPGGAHRHRLSAKPITAPTLTVSAISIVPSTMTSRSAS